MMKNRISKTFCLLIQLKPILLGIAIFNLITSYINTFSEVGDSYCFGTPWYSLADLRYFPLYLLLSVLGFYVNKWWSVTIAAFFSAVIIERFITYHIRLADTSATSGFRIQFDTLQDQLLFQPSLTFQFVFAAVILILAIIHLLKRI